MKYLITTEQNDTIDTPRSFDASAGMVELDWQQLVETAQIAAAGAFNDVDRELAKSRFQIGDKDYPDTSKQMAVRRLADAAARAATALTTLHYLQLGRARRTVRINNKEDVDKIEIAKYLSELNRISLSEGNFINGCLNPERSGLSDRAIDILTEAADEAFESTDIDRAHFTANLISQLSKYTGFEDINKDIEWCK